MKLFIYVIFILNCLITYQGFASDVQPNTIGVILPMTGKQSNIAQRTLRGIQMGLGLQNHQSQFKLAVMDSEGSPDKARRAVDTLVEKDKVIAIIGSISSKEGVAIAARANELGVPNISLSQKSGLTDSGPFIFRNAVTAEMQVRELVRVMMSEQNMKKFAIMYPNDSYGVEYANLFWDEVLARGGEIVAAQIYSTKEKEFKGPVQRLFGNFYGEARLEELRQRQKLLTSTSGDTVIQKKKSVRETNADNLLPPITDFDAVFIPDTTKVMGQIAAMMAYQDARNLTLIGTNLWNNPDVIRRAANANYRAIFVDGISPIAQSSFLTEYKEQFGENAGLLETQAYDSALMIKQMILSGAQSREDLQEKLLNKSLFQGAIGPMFITPDRETQRPMTILTTDSGSIVPLGQLVKKE